MAQEKHYEMQWDCQFCGTPKLLGKTHRFCPNCGAPQDPDARYFPKEEDKVAVEDHVFVGKDVICPACGGLNSADAHNCGNCGSPLEAGERARTATDGFTAGAVPVGERDVAQEQFEREMSAAGITTNAAEKKRRGSNLIGGLVMIGVLLVCGGGFWLFSQTQAVVVTAAEHTWEREIRIEQFQAVRDEAWRDQVPSAAYRVSCNERERDTRRVQTGEECRTERRDNGDGTFTERQVCEPTYRNEPIMDDWCSYTIDRWAYERSVTTDGRGVSPAPEWGRVNLACTGERLNCEREAGREERYTVTFRGDGERHTCTFPLSEWQNITPDSRWTLEVRRFATGALCDTLQRAG